MTNEELFLKDVCPNHTDKSQWNKSELLHILKLHKEQLRLHNVNDKLDNMVDEWHNSNSELPLHEYLGMTKEEYELWVKNPDEVSKHYY